MDNKDKQILIERYKERFQKHGDDILALASGTEERRNIRFNVHIELGNLQGADVLDIGCGLADFYGFLCKKNIKTNYCGVDIVDDFVNRSRELYPEQKFLCVDIQNSEEIPDDGFDYAFCSQVLNNKFQNSDNVEVATDIMSTLYKKVRKGFAIDFITNYVDYEEDRHYYYSPEKMFSTAKKLSKRITLRHDYPLYEFTLYVYKDFKGWNTEQK